MRIIFIRHGDPDYVHDSLTEKGMREAKLLADRVVNWSVTDFYCSPLGRAQKTASYSLERLHRQATTYEWMKEFSYDVDDPVTGRHGVPWDFMPEYWTEQAAFMIRITGKKPPFISPTRHWFRLTMKCAKDWMTC